VALASLGGAALAQSPACNAWRSELASLQGQRGGDPRSAQAAQRAGAQLAQVTSQYRSMGCDRSFSFFGEGPPPQCGLLRSQIGQLQAQYGAAQRQAEGGSSEQRRAQLAAAIDNNCRPQQQQRGFFETIFGIEPRRGEIDTTLPELQPEQPLEPEKPRMGGAYTVCVRSCDGFFFPLANNAGNADEMCQALCPGTETSAFGMTGGGDIQNAVSRSTGQPYTSLANAGKYQRSFDAACTCKGQGQSWAQTLKDAEYLLDADEKPMPSENSPTAGTESAGVGPDTVGEKVLSKGDGVKSETKSVTGEKRTVRIVAPNLAPNLGPSATRQ
jgi:hypothetical protein